VAEGEGGGSRRIKQIWERVVRSKEQTSISAVEDGGAGAFGHRLACGWLTGLAGATSSTGENSHLDRGKFGGGQESLFPFFSSHNKNEIQGFKCRKSRRWRRADGSDALFCFVLT